MLQESHDFLSDRGFDGLPRPHKSILKSCSYSSSTAGLVNTLDSIELLGILAREGVAMCDVKGLFVLGLGI